MGIAAIPVIFASKKPSVSWQKYQSHLPTEWEIARWFRPGRRTNAAVICGWCGLTVLDFDDLSGFVKWQAWALSNTERSRKVALETYRVKTSRGLHLYLFVKDTPRCSHFEYGDIKGQGGYVLIPPSVHPSGAIYEAVDADAAILSIDTLDEVIEDAPQAAAVQIAPTVQVFPTSSLWPASAIEQIKESLSILSFFADAKATGGGGRWYMARCLFHDDADPSMWIDAQKGICGCYSGCTSKPLDVVGVYAKVHGISDKEAIHRLIEQVR